MTGGQRELEHELKFALDASAGGRLRNSGTVARARVGRWSSRTLVTTYFDTRQHGLRRAGIALRVRRRGRAFEQTIKIPIRGLPGMQSCEEWTVPVGGGLPDLALFDPAVLARLPRGGQRLALQPLFTTEITRHACELRHQRARFELAVDAGEIRTHGATTRSQAVSEIELELLGGRPTGLLDFALQLNEDFDLQPLFSSKAQRGFALTRPSLRPQLVKAVRPALSVQDTAGSAFLEIVGCALQHLQGNVQPTLECRPLAVHQSRVAIRRIRAALRVFRRELPYDKRKAFNGELRWFQLRLAPARDWHVFLSESLPRIIDAPAGADAQLERLHRLALRERRRAGREAAAVMGSRRFIRLLLQFQRWMLELEAEQPGMFRCPLRPYARRALDRTRRELLADPRPLSRMSEAERHGLRKRGKKARYAMEFFSGLWPGPEADRYIELFEQLQDRLGEANDATTARLLMASLPPRALPLPALLLVQEWSQSRELDCVRSGQPVWRRMQHAQPFWQDR